MSNSRDTLLEIVKISINEEHQHFCFKPHVMEDPIDWGYLLADFARLLSHSYEGYQDGNNQSVLKRILEGFEAELKSELSDQDLAHPPQVATYLSCK